MTSFIRSSEKSILVNDAKSQGSSYLKGWGTEWNKKRKSLCSVYWFLWYLLESEHQAFTLIIKIVKGNL